MTSKIKIELVVEVDTAQANKLLETITRSVKTWKIGDGKIFVLPTEGAVWAGTKEKQENTK
ncbi:MAG TPA: P-II family nitrogen regulator [Anaerolineae bacterium]|nr:P-II family nitrogen regulator [Anaerolineae bacterium]